jgi:hypothetical protein
VEQEVARLGAENFTEFVDSGGTRALPPLQDFIQALNPHVTKTRQFSLGSDLGAFHEDFYAALADSQSHSPGFLLKIIFYGLTVKDKNSLPRPFFS